MYVGKAASLSFLQLLRETVTQHIGPSQFSHNYKSEDMLENEAHHDALNFSEDHCSLEAKRRFIQTFSIAVGTDPTRSTAAAKARLTFHLRRVGSSI